MVEEFKLAKAIPKVKNKAYYFMLPLIADNDFFEDIIDCYLGDKINKSKYTFNKIFVHVASYNDKYTQLGEFYQSYELEDDTYMFVYNIPEHFIDDHIKFCDGQYSKMSDNAKDKICKFSGVRPVMKSMVYKILYKTNDRKEYIEELVGEKLPEDAEVASIIDEDKEIYNYCRIKQGRSLV